MSERRTIRVVRHDTGEALELWEGTPSIGICEAPTCGCDEEIDGERLRVLSIEGTPTLDGDPDIGWTAVVAKVEVNGEARTRSCVTLAHTIYCGEDEPEAAFIAIDDEWVRCHAETWRMRAARFDEIIREASEALVALGAGRNDGQSLADAIRALGPSVLRCARCGAFLPREQGIVRAPAADPHQALCLACDREVFPSWSGRTPKSPPPPCAHCGKPSTGPDRRVGLYMQFTCSTACCVALEKEAFGSPESNKELDEPQAGGLGISLEEAVERYGVAPELRSFIEAARTVRAGGKADLRGTFEAYLKAITPQPPPGTPVVFIYDPGNHGSPCHAARKDTTGPWSNIKKGLCGFELSGVVPWCYEPDGGLCRRCAPLVEKTAEGWHTKAGRAASEQKPDKPSGLAAIVGRWPGDETDEEVNAALAEGDTVPPPAAPPVEHSSEPGDVCPACSDVLGSPSPCAITHDFAPGAYPPPEPDLEPAVGDEPKGAP